MVIIDLYNVQINVDEGNYTGCIFLDLSKAFDFLFYLYIYSPDSQESDGGAKTY